MLAAVAQDMQVNYNKVSIRMQKTRWGSCSCAGNISLNAKLLFFSPEITHYVLVHELAHRRFMNHSAAFWAHVEQFELEYRLLRKALHEEARALPVWAR